MSTTAEAFISTCFDDLRLSQRFVPYVQKAEAAGYPQLAKFFRAMVASETVREALCRSGIPSHADQEEDYFVCPHCGLIYDRELPDQCVVDQTPGQKFIVIR